MKVVMLWCRGFWKAACLWSKSPLFRDRREAWATLSIFPKKMRCKATKNCWTPSASFLEGEQPKKYSLEK